jgi:hypothetical protein
MQESLVKLVVVLTALVSLLVGGVFLVIPGWFVVVSGATLADIGWLRSIGASVVGLQGFGLLIAAFRRRDTNPLIGIVALVTTIEAGAVWYSLFAGEYGETGRWAVIVPAILATVSGVLLWFSWLSRRKTVGGLPPRGQKRRVATSDAAAVAEPEPEAAADLVEEIDAESPRLKQ